MGRSKSLDALAESLRSTFTQAGPRQSRRMALRVLSLPVPEFAMLIEAMKQVRAKVTRCDVCQDLTESRRCGICSDADRDRGLLCVVENSHDVEAIEASRSYQGLYHVLHGSLDHRGGLRSEQGWRALPTLQDLWLRLGHDKSVQEVILALDQDTAGELTTLYLTREIQKNFPNLRLARIGVGIPFGGEVVYSDPLTLKQALQSRLELRAREPEKEVIEL